MAQLSDDCFAHGGKLMTTAEALALLAEKVRCITAIETKTVHQCLGRILASDLLSSVNVPPHDNSAVDGYAVAFDDLVPGETTVLPISERMAAGTPLPDKIKIHTAVRIFTGAVMPQGTDTVLMQEDCVLDQNGNVSIPSGIKRGANSRKAGEDVTAGTVIFQAGHRLKPQDLGLISAVGITEIPVRRPLQVALFSTGDELQNPGTMLKSGQVYDSNRFTITGLLQNLGCAVTDLGILSDDFEVIRHALGEAAGQFDLILTSGGVSVGEEDHVKQAVECQGSLHAWRLAIKPGRPIALGQIGSTAFVGLPGNPVAVVVTFANFVRPLIALLSGNNIQPPRCFPITAAFTHRKKAARREWIRVHLRKNSEGLLEAHKFPKEGAGVLSSVCASDGFAELPEDLLSVEPGQIITYLPFNEVGL
ncbi:molybdopterin molybdotransferase MoeA [Kiloniella laminariae]|uniref:Molybdopterin molybdenumtransferase n=1 Tax=Kiloniella laminariae TaxID=454162 RepID=A0ABT4LPK0_9PROT|nr:gephyrin-like molybdotransferase Glp [Kiloniella laminariae]MCZ4281877.1 molybdopterin molybdotransferase MoeA [Kiloniella laminariae]